MTPQSLFLLAAALLGVWLYARYQRERDMPPEERAELERTRAARSAARQARLAQDPERGAPPEQPYTPQTWAPLVDTASDGRISDDGLLFLEAVLREQGIPTEFEPWRPGGHFGQIGPQYPLRLLVDAARLTEAREVLAEFAEYFGGHNWQMRLVNPMLNVPGAREEMLFYAGLRKRSAEGGWWRWAWLAVVVLLILGLLRW